MRRNGLTPCYHVIDGGRVLCGVKNPFWQAIVNGSGEAFDDETRMPPVVPWEPWNIGFAGPARPLPDNMICGRCSRILKSKSTGARQ